MKRIKATENFYWDELIHPAIYKRFYERSRLYMNPQLLILLQAIRENYGKSITINNWAIGGKFKNSGLRDYKNPLGKLNRSRHYYGLAIDMKADDIKALQAHVYDNRDIYYDLGLRVIEDYRYTASWCHISVEETKLDKVKIMIP